MHEYTFYIPFYCVEKIKIREFLKFCRTYIDLEIVNSGLLLFSVNVKLYIPFEICPLLDDLTVDSRIII